MDKNL
jgi:hypothetical protein